MDHQPSHLTPASREWVHAGAERIGLLVHNTRVFFELVHCTLLRKMGPVPTPYWALLKAIPPAVPEIKITKAKRFEYVHLICQNCNVLWHNYILAIINNMQPS